MQDPNLYSVVIFDDVYTAYDEGSVSSVVSAYDK